jgi:hypothetical protein
MQRSFDDLIRGLGQVHLAPIEVAPFRVEYFGTEFGLIYTRFEESEWVELHPGNYVAFTPPWDGGYDT